MTDSDKPKGEFVVPKTAVEYYGANVMEAIRRMIIPKDAFSKLLHFDNVTTVKVSASEASALRDKIESIVKDLIKKASRKGKAE